MKKYLFTSIFVLSLVLSAQAQPGVAGQYFQAAIKQSGNLLQFFVRPNPVSNGGSNIANMKFDNFDFFIRYPSANPIATFGAPVVNTVDFPGLTIAQDIFGQDPYGADPGFRLVEWTSPFGSATSTALTYNAGQEYLVFSVTVTNCSPNFQLSADNINGAPYFLTITRNTAGIGGFGDYTAQGGYGNLTNQLFYNPSPANLTFTPPFSYFQKISSTDYFRSIASGNWNAPATWESSTVSNFATLLSPAPLSPDVSSNDINIRNGHTVTVTADVSTDQTFVNAGGALVATGSTLTVIGTPGLTVQSSAAGTGRIGNSTGSITGSVSVERYINSDVVGRKWHLLSGVATTTAQTVRASWQEGGGAPSTPNTGTWVTAPGTPAGYDGSSVDYSILTHNPAGPSWVNLAATNTGSINAQRAYMLFVRGDRFAQPPPNALQAPTVLRTIGTLNQGTQPAVTVLSASPGYTIMGNPFASPIDLENVLTTANLGQFFYVWDASIAGNFGVGRFRLVQKTGAATYTATPTTGSDNSTRYIHSGQGFFLKATGANANVVLNESHKTNLLSVVNPIVNTAGNQQIYTELSIADQAGKEYVTDAVRVWFNTSYSAGTPDDILKIGNFSDNISSYRGDKKWIVENRPMIVSNDTIFLRTSGMSIHNYRLKINTQDFVQTGVTAFLQDTWLGTNTPLSLDGSVTDVDFSVTGEPASANADRFRIVFSILKADVPVIVAAGVKGIAIYPNPVSGSVVNIKFTDMEKGIYQLRLISVGGQLVMSQQVNHGGGSSTLRMGLDKMIANGNYQLEIIKPDNSKTMKSLIIVK